jgi:phosphoglycerate kinase
MAYTFLKAFLKPVGKSLLEEDRVTLAKALVQKARDRGHDFLFPVDHVVTMGGKDDAYRTTDGVEIVGDEAGVDIGPRTAEAFARALATARTVLWNGPLGRFEVEAFSHGTRRVAEALAASKAVSVVGGGDRREDDARLDGRGRLARGPLRAPAPRGRGARRGALTCAARSSSATGR